MILPSAPLVYKSGYKHTVVERIEVELPFATKEVTVPTVAMSSNGWLGLAEERDGRRRLIIRPGYAFDGVTWFPDLRCMMRAAAIHDAWYQLIRMGLLAPETRDAADRYFADLCVYDGLPRIFRGLVYHALRLGGGYAADPANRRRVRVAGWEAL